MPLSFKSVMLMFSPSSVVNWGWLLPSVPSPNCQALFKPSYAPLSSYPLAEGMLHSPELMAPGPEILK